MFEDELLERLNRLEYHQSLLLKMVEGSKARFDMLVIEKGLSERDVQIFYKQCEQLSMELEEQKAEGFVYFHPLFNKFQEELHPRLKVEEVIHACILQKLFLLLMDELKRYI
jgi:hypothetical protein